MSIPNVLVRKKIFTFFKYAGKGDFRSISGKLPDGLNHQTLSGVSVISSEYKSETFLIVELSHFKAAMLNSQRTFSIKRRDPNKYQVAKMVS